MLKLYDTLSRKKKTFRPMKTGEVTMYNCGPTVYDYVHIGNLRSFVFADILRRFLEYRGYKVTQIMNITDVGHMMADADEGEDKIETAASEAGKTPAEVVKFYTDAFFKDIDRLNIRRAAAYPRASEHVEDMIKLVSRLVEKRCAYKVQGDGGTNVYFDVSSFAGYGKLSGNKLEDLNPGARIEVRDEKKHPADFALWIHNPSHLMQWEAPWGSGYPGWHLECSAMATKYLGDTIDIHTGGEDNKFPHHECEIAQSECATGKPFARNWLHVTHLMVEGKKMSKSIGNYFTLDDLTAKGYEPRVVRYLLASVHYRQSLNFTFKGLDAARGALSRFDNFVESLSEYASKEGGDGKVAKDALKKLSKAMDDDLNVAEALAVAFDFVRETNEKMANGELGRKDKMGAEVFIKEFGHVLGFTFGRSSSDEDVPKSVLALVERRDAARAEKRFAEADKLRDEIISSGFIIEDTEKGTKVKRA